MITETGWTRERVNSMELPAVFELVGHWAKYPTPAMMLRAYFDVKPPAVDEKEFERAISAPDVVSGLGSPRQLSEEMRGIIAWAEEQKEKMGGKDN